MVRHAQPACALPFAREKKKPLRVIYNVAIGGEEEREREWVEGMAGSTMPSRRHPGRPGAIRRAPKHGSSLEEVVDERQVWEIAVETRTIADARISLLHLLRGTRRRRLDIAIGVGRRRPGGRHAHSLLLLLWSGVILL